MMILKEKIYSIFSFLIFLLYLLFLELSAGGYPSDQPYMHSLTIFRIYNFYRFYKRLFDYGITMILFFFAIVSIITIFISISRILKKSNWFFFFEFDMI